MKLVFSVISINSPTLLGAKQSTPFLHCPRNLRPHHQKQNDPVCNMEIMSPLTLGRDPVVWLCSKTFQVSSFVDLSGLLWLLVSTLLHRVFNAREVDNMMLKCNTEKDRHQTKHHTAGKEYYTCMYSNIHNAFFTPCAGTVLGAWPCGTITVLGELFGAESNPQVYATIHTFLYENEYGTSDLSRIAA